MDENLNIVDPEASELDIVEDGIDVESSEQNIAIEEDVGVIEIESADEIEIELDEAVAWVGGDSTRHYSLYGRDEPNQHPIKAIIGLEERLDEIETLQTVYSDTVGTANFYKWNTGTYDEVGYFVSMVPHTSNIQVCDGTNIFGVTVDRAGFIGGQDDIPRNGEYALVATSGLVDVRCELDVVVGDCVVCNAYGIAEKTTSECGYKVVAINNKHGIVCASIVLGIQACVTDAIGRDVKIIQDNLDDMNINIAAAMEVANSAYNKTLDSDAIAEEVKKQMQDAMDKVDNIEDVVGSIENVTTSTSVIAAEARAIAENAVTEAERLRGEANKTANESLSNVNALINKLEPLDEWVDPVTGQVGASYVATYMNNAGLATTTEVETVEKLTEDNKSSIERNAESISTMVASVDKYSVGEYSQSYGLTLEQAQNILKQGMVYIPTADHTENYSEITYDFSDGYSYVWDGNTWQESVGRVWLGKEQPAGTIYEYWYDGATLFILQDEEWVEVATLAGNVNNRITSMIRQDVNSVSAEVVNARGSYAGLNARLEADNEAYAQMVASVVNADGTVNTASIVNSVNDSGSSVAINADKIVMTGTTTFLTADGVNESGATVIDGSRIIAGSIQADKIDATNLRVDAANIDGTITANTIDATSGSIGGFTIGEQALSVYNSAASNVYLGTDRISLGGGKFAVSSDGALSATSGTIGGCTINGRMLELKVGNSTLFSAGYNSTLGRNAVTIAGWSVDDNSFYNGSQFSSSDCFICTGSTGESGKFDIGGSGSINGWMIKAGSHFGVTNTGALYANAGYIGGSTGWAIDANKLYCGNRSSFYFSPVEAQSTQNNGICIISDITKAMSNVYFEGAGGISLGAYSAGSSSESDTYHQQVLYGGKHVFRGKVGTTQYAGTTIKTNGLWFSSRDDHDIPVNSDASSDAWYKGSIEVLPAGVYLKGTWYVGSSTTTLQDTISNIITRLEALEAK